MSFRINTNVMAMNALRNLGGTNADFSKSITRLSTGLRINSAADDPAGLIASENFRAQISGINQAIRNNQDAINMSKTAEGALDEIGRLMREARGLAVASANVGALSNSQLQANQIQLNLIVQSIDRIANETQFGTKKLLNGSAGVSSVVVNGTNFSAISLGGRIGGQDITADGAVDINVTTAATKAVHTGTRQVASASQAAYLAAAVGAGAAGTFAINGQSITVTATETWGDVINKINAIQGQTGVMAEAFHDGANGSVRLRSSNYGANATINLVDSAGVIQSAAGVATASGINGVAEVTVAGLNAVTFTGGQYGNDGLTLSDSNGNRIVMTEAGNTVANNVGAGQVIVGAAQFQTGANAGQITMMSLGNFSSNALNFSNLDITSATGSSAAITAIDAAIDNLSGKRGEIGSFMKNVLESNVRSLGVASENLSSTESMIRDTDVAQEMTQFTKLQILQQSGLAVLAQANAAPQAVLSLLR